MIRRRALLKGAMAAGTGALFTTSRARAAAEAPPETTRLRLFKFPGLCLAPQYIAEDLLQAEGFTDVQYLDFPEGAVGVFDRVASSAVDFTQWYGVPFIEEIDKGRPIVFLAGVHIGCTELFATERIRTIRDLKGKTLAVAVGSPAQSILAAMLAYVGLDHRKDLTFTTHSPAESVRLLAEAKIDAFLATPPWGRRSFERRRIGHEIVNSAVDRPWSQYFCCMVGGQQGFRPQASRGDQASVARHPRRPPSSVRWSRSGSPAPSSTETSRRATSTRSRR